MDYVLVTINNPQISVTYNNKGLFLAHVSCWPWSSCFFELVTGNSGPWLKGQSWWGILSYAMAPKTSA